MFGIKALKTAVVVLREYITDRFDIIEKNTNKLLFRTISRDNNISTINETIPNIINSLQTLKDDVRLLTESVASQQKETKELQKIVEAMAKLQ